MVTFTRHNRYPNLKNLPASIELQLMPLVHTCSRYPSYNKYCIATHRSTAMYDYYAVLYFSSAVDGTSVCGTVDNTRAWYTRAWYTRAWYTCGTRSWTADDKVYMSSVDEGKYHRQSDSPVEKKSRHSNVEP